jgi:DHA2 family multidrug resistance protein-like MFS transporter
MASGPAPQVARNAEEAVSRCPRQNRSLIEPLHASTESRTMSQAPPLATRKEWIGLAMLALPTLLLSLDMSVLYLAIPELTADLRPSSTQLLWILDIYGFLIAGFLVTMGTLGDRIGRRRLLLIGASVFSLASVAVAFSQSAEMLIASRAVLGIAGATLMPSTLALITNMFRDDRQRGFAFAVWMSCFSAGTAIGPLLGGAMLEFYWWGSVFLLGVPVMVVLLIFGPRLLPEHRSDHAGRLDLVSVALSLATILPFVYGVKELAKHGLDGRAVAGLGVGVAVGVVFVRRQLALADPLVDVRLFRRPTFTAAISMMLIATLAMGGLFFLLSQYLQMVAGLTPFQAGLGSVPPAIAVMVSSMIASTFARKIGVARILTFGFLLSAIGCVMIALVDSHGDLALAIAANTLIALGLGPTGAICTNLIISSAPPERAGSASSMSETGAELGIALGVASLGSLAAFVYRDRITGDLPAGLDEGARRAAGDSLPNALSAAAGLDATLADQVIAASRTAFVDGMSIVAMIAVIAMLAIAAIAWRAFRGIDSEAVLAGGHSSEAVPAAAD